MTRRAELFVERRSVIGSGHRRREREQGPGQRVDERRRADSHGPSSGKLADYMPGMAILARMTRLSTRIVVYSLVAPVLALVVSGFSRTADVASGFSRTADVASGFSRTADVVSGFSRTLFAAQQCVDHSKDPAGCQPSTFDTPMAQMPSVRVNRQGQIDPTSSEADAKAGAFELEKR